MAYGRNSKSIAEPTSDAMQSDTQASAAQSSASILSSGMKSRVLPSALLFALANASPDNCTVKDEFATISPSPVQEPAAGLFFGKNSRDYSPPTTSVNASQGSHVSMNAGGSSEQAVTFPRSASSWQAASSWSTLGKDCRAPSSSFPFTNVLLATQANMGTNWSDAPEEDEDQSPFQHPGTQRQRAASQLSAAQPMPYTMSPALGMSATVSSPLEFADASTAARTNVQMPEPFFRAPISNGYPVAQHAPFRNAHGTTSIIPFPLAEVANASPAPTFTFTPQPQPPTFFSEGPYRPVGAPSCVIFPERSGVHNSTASLGNTSPCHSSFLELTDMVLDSFADPGYARAMVTHAQATIDNLTAENETLKRKVKGLNGVEADNQELEATNYMLEAMVNDLQAGMRELLSRLDYPEEGSSQEHNQSFADENDALKRKVKELEASCIELEKGKLKTEARMLSQMADALEAQEKKLLSQLHSYKEGSSQDHEQSESQDGTTTSAGEHELDALADDASSSSSVTEGGMVDRSIKVEESEDAIAAHEQDLTDSVDESSTTRPNITVPGWRPLTAAERKELAGGDENYLAMLNESAARDHGPTDSYAGGCGKGTRTMATWSRGKATSAPSP
jgi:cell division protein FtsB